MVEELITAVPLIENKPGIFLVVELIVKLPITYTLFGPLDAGQKAEVLVKV